MSALRRLLHGALQRALPGMRWVARLILHPQQQEELRSMSDLMSANEALMAMPLPTMLAGLGKAVATANAELAQVPGPDQTRMRVTEATIELNVAIAVDSSKKIEAGGDLKLQAFSVNASYARTFNFKEEASSKITMKIVVAPAGQPAA